MTFGVQSQMPYKRDQLTWYGYLLYGFWSYVWGLFGPLMPFLRAELHINYAIASLHFSALALGPLIAGIIGYRVITAVGAARVIPMGVTAVMLGVACVYFGRTPYDTIFGAFLVGCGGSHAGQSIIASLSNRQHGHRAKTITELVIFSSLGSAITPMIVATALRMGMPWKSPIAFCVPILLAIWLSTKFGRTDNFVIKAEPNATEQPLPKCYWTYFTVVFLSVAAEWSVAFWSPEFLESVRHFSRPDASGGLTAFLISMLIGRVSGTKLVDFISPRKLLMSTCIFALCGFALFWLSTTPLLAVAGLALLGLGMSNIYPLSLSLAMSDAPGCTTKAASRMSLSTGSACLIGPFVLGTIADHFGLWNSYGLIAVLLMCATIATRYTLKKQPPQLGAPAQELQSSAASQELQLAASQGP